MQSFVNWPPAPQMVELPDHRLPPGPAGCQHGVFRSPHAGQAQGNLPALQGRCLTAQTPALFLHCRPQLPQRRQMQVNRPGPQFTAARVRHLRLSQPSQNGTQENGRRAHLPHQMIRHVPAAHSGCVHHQLLPLPPGLTPQVPQDPNAGFHIAEPGAAPKYRSARVQNGGGQYRQHAVLRPLDRQDPFQPVTSPDNNMLHIDPSAYGFSN